MVLSQCVEAPTSYRDKDGYAKKQVGGRSEGAHRAAWKEAYGPIPDGLFVMHRCDNPACINVQHLMLGTPKDNWEDCVEKDRHCRGERHPKAKLGKAKVLEIRRRAAEGETQASLASEFGVSITLLSFVVNRKVWRHI